MQRYHDPSTDPLPLHSPQHEVDRAEIHRLTIAFLASGGMVEQVGHRMSSAAPTFTINPERSPVYAHLFAPAAPKALGAAAVPDIAPVSTGDTDEKTAGLILAAAALGDAPDWIARKLHMTEKRVRQIARDYRINFHNQR